jgi:hypothetical protein
VTENDPSIADETDLLRRIHPTQVIWDDNDGCLRPTSAAFKGVEMSVSLADDIERLRLTSAYALRNHPQHHLVALTAGFVRGEEQVVCRHHLEDDECHGDVIGSKPKSRRSLFAKAARWDILQSELLAQDLQSKHLAA